MQSLTGAQVAIFIPHSLLTFTAIYQAVYKPMELCHHCTDPEGHSSPPCMLECPNHHLSQSLREEGP